MAEIRELERGVWLSDSLPDEVRHPVESLCHLLANCVTDAVVALALFEQALADNHGWQRPSEERWQRDAERHRQREAELEAQNPRTPADPGYFEWQTAISEQARLDVQRQKWAEDGGPEAYRRRLPFIHARSFVTTLALLQRTLWTMRQYEFGSEAGALIQRAYADLTGALPNLKDVRDSTAHAEDRTRGEARGDKIALAPIMNQAIHAPGGGVLVMDMLNGRNFGCTIADGTYAEVEISDATTEIARAAVQAVYDALPWRPGHRLRDPSQ